MKAKSVRYVPDPDFEEYLRSINFKSLVPNIKFKEHINATSFKSHTMPFLGLCILYITTLIKLVEFPTWHPINLLLPLTMLFFLMTWYIMR
jgi:hypothetical protein